ncbi:MAG: hypothetical protein HKL95_06085 [Phycisphaerae bacterium]|nr:hypothetical protein [Phycisphaerae bacterium]
MTNMPVLFFLAMIALCITGAALSAWVAQHRIGPLLAVTGSLASLMILACATSVLITRQPMQIDLWHLPLLGLLRLRLDTVSALFVLALGISFLPAYLFSKSYMNRYPAHYNIRGFGMFFHLLLMACTLVLAAGDVITFLFSWRLMSALATFPITLEHRQDEHRRAGYLFLAMNEAGIILATVGLLLMTAWAAGHIGFTALHQAMEHIQAGGRWAIFLMIFAGFSVKAGLVPVSSWLPRAHPVAPANMSAVLSGCMLNFGIYGIIRFDAIIMAPATAGPGLVVLAIGGISALLGILYATIDNDLKRMLAHSSIENLGLIAVDIGAGMVFAAYHMPVIAAIAWVVAIYHLINHSAYKTLLFLGAGAIDHGTGTRDMNALGGLLKRMPVTAALFLVGALAIAAMPPLNGFVSEWLTLQTILRSTELASRFSRVIFALCGAGLALTAALAVTCFVKTFAMSFLGLPRSDTARTAVESPQSMRVAMGVLAVICIALGLGATWVIPLVDRSMFPLTHQLAANALVPPFFTLQHGNAQFSRDFLTGFEKIGADLGKGVVPARGLVILHQGKVANPVVYAMSTFYMAVVLVGIMLIVYLLVRLTTRRRTVSISEPWAAGLRRLWPDMSYSATGFSNPVRIIFKSIFGPAQREDSQIAVAGHFRTAIRRPPRDTYIVDRIFLRPLVGGVKVLAGLMARLHRPAVVNAYAAWVFIVLLFVLVMNRLF